MFTGFFVNSGIKLALQIFKSLNENDAIETEDHFQLTLTKIDVQLQFSLNSNIGNNHCYSYFINHDSKYGYRK